MVASARPNSTTSDRGPRREQRSIYIGRKLSKVLGEDYAAIAMIDQGTLPDGFQIAQLGDPEEHLIRLHEAVDKVVGSGTR